MQFLPHDHKFFELFGRQGELLAQAARRLGDAFTGPAEDWDEVCRQLATIEKAGDEAAHAVIVRLIESLVTPFDSEDVYRLTTALDDALDSLEGLAQRVRIFGLTSFPEPMRRIVELIEKSAQECRHALESLHNRRDLSAQAMQIRGYETAVDEIYRQALYELFRLEIETLELIKHKELYDRLEAATDRLQAISYILEEIHLKSA